MSQVHLYLSSEQRSACLLALHTTQRWVQGDVGVFAELADADILRDKDGKSLSLSKWSTIVEPALTEYACLAAGTTPGTVLDVHDPATHPLGAMAFQLQEQWGAVKVSRKCSTLAAMPTDMELHKTGDDAFDVYHKMMDKQTAVYTLKASGLNAGQVADQCSINKPIFKMTLDSSLVHPLMRVLDIHSRILMNQWEYLKELTEDLWETRRPNWHELVGASVRAFKEPWTKYSMNASSGIHSEKIHPNAMVVWNVQKALRHWEIVQRLGYSHRGVSSDSPMRGEQWPLVDGQASAGLTVLPVGGGIFHTGQSFVAVQSYTTHKTPPLASLALSYSPVSLLDALAYSQAHPAQAPTF